MTRNTSAKIRSTGSYLPKRILTNNELALKVGCFDQNLEKTTGIERRHLAAAHEATSDLAVRAASEALAHGQLDSQSIDLILVGTMTGDFLVPATACVVQEKLGARNAVSLDLEAGSCSFNYMLDLGARFIADGTCKTALLVCAEKISYAVDWTDLDNCFFWGDGAGAVILEMAQNGSGILSSSFGVYGEWWDAVCIPAGGSKLPISLDAFGKKMNTFKMDLEKVRNFSVVAFPDAVREAVAKCNLSVQDIDLIVPDQSDFYIINEGMASLGLPMDKAYIGMNRCGNIGSASLPVALDHALKSKKVQEDDLLVLAGFGAGLACGVNILRW